MLQHEGTKGTKGQALQISHQVIGGAIEVHRFLGPGLLESVYEEALCRELMLRGLAVERQVQVQVQLRYKGIDLASHLRLDLVVEDQVVVEVKSVAKVLPVHKAQVLSYLRLYNRWLGLLINFEVELLRLGVSRILNG
jgi:GxxExxY protein